MSTNIEVLKAFFDKYRNHHYKIDRFDQENCLIFISYFLGPGLIVMKFVEPKERKAIVPHIEIHVLGDHRDSRVNHPDSYLQARILIGYDTKTATITVCVPATTPFDKEGIAIHEAVLAFVKVYEVEKQQQTESAAA